jgi:NAD-dependent dihydropyrimidine dehydrogenase PreA subunit
MRRSRRSERRSPTARAAAAAGLAAFGVASVACTAILGVKDVPPNPDASSVVGAGSVDGAHPDVGDAEASVAPSDGGTGDATITDVTPIDPTDGDGAPIDSTGTEVTPIDAATGDVAPIDALPDAVAGGGPVVCNLDDSHNCGACFHDCLGGACSAGKCQPFPLLAADAGINPYSLAQDDASLYWVDDLSPNTVVGRTDKVKGGVTVTYAQTDGPATVDVDTSAVYWGDGLGIWRCPKAGCTSGPAMVATVSEGVAALTVEQNGPYLYFRDGSPASPRLYSVHKLGTSETGVLVFSGDAGIENVANDGQNVYLTADDGLLHVVSLDGGAPVAIGTPNSAGSHAIAYDQNVVYWTIDGLSAGAVIATSIPSLQSTPLAGSQSDPNSVASDGTNVYWVTIPGSDQINAGIEGCLVGSCAPSVVSRPYTAPLSVVVDSAAVYWSEATTGGGPGGTIWKLAK